MIVLPKERQEPKPFNSHFMILYGKPKQGKSSFIASLDDTLVIDLENGYEALPAMVVQARTIQDFADIVEAIREEIKTTGKKPYKRIVIDNATRLEELCLPYALTMYKLTPQGKSFTGNDVRTLPQGGGYFWVRKAVRKIIDLFIDLCDTRILVGHVKDKLINVDGQDISDMEIDLAGKLGNILCGEADAIGYVYRKKNETIISFDSGTDFNKGARPDHLTGNKIVVAESDENRKITFYPERIFLPEVE